MSSTPPEAETYEVTFSRDEQWVVHHVVADLLDDALADEEAPPAWAIDLLRTIEADVDVLTRKQARRLAETLETYLDREETPDRDLVHGAAVLERLDGILDANSQRSD